jgi:hypothetical protein
MTAELRRKKMLFHAIALGLSLAGFIVGYLVQRAKWGGNLGNIIGLLSGPFVVFFALALLLVPKVGEPR